MADEEDCFCLEKLLISAALPKPFAIRTEGVECYATDDNGDTERGSQNFLSRCSAKSGGMKTSVMKRRGKRPERCVEGFLGLDYPSDASGVRLMRLLWYPLENALCVEVTTPRHSRSLRSRCSHGRTAILVRLRS